jgi:hypothetical protein
MTAMQATSPAVSAKPDQTSALDRKIASFVPSLTIRIGCDRQMTLGGGQILAQIKGTRADAAT